jgi:Tol biopolymer transport system component
MPSNRVAVAPALVVALGIAGIAGAATGDTRLVSVVASGARAAGDSNLRHGGDALSGDGRYIVFHSFRPGVVPDDQNNASDVFLRDLVRGETQLVSASVDGGVGNASAADGSISADGLHVAYISSASDLVQRDRNAADDVFIWNRATGATELASVGSSGVQGNGASVEAALSADGRYVAFTSFASNLARGDTNASTDVFLRDRQGGYTERVSIASDGRQANGFSWQPSVSADGRYVVFYSTATNLVPNDRGGRQDVFVRDRQTGQTRRLTEATDGTGANGYSVQPTMSGNGRHVAFVSAASNLVPGDTNGRIDVFVSDLETGRMERVSVSSKGGQGNGGSYYPSLSADGRYVVFESFASNLVPGDTNASYDVFVHDRETHQTRRVSVAADGAQANGANWTPAVSGDGRFVAFRSDATNFGRMDANHSSDVYVKDMGPSDGSTTAYTIKPAALDFGLHAIDSRTTLSFWLRNRSGTHLSIESMGVRGTDRGAFAVAHACGTMVAPDDVCGIHVTFHPASAGSMSAELEVHAGGDTVRRRELLGAAQ